MTPFKTVQVALRGLRRNKGRSALTALGIVIGIAAVITMMEIGKGSSSAIAKSIASMGANQLLILPGQAASGGISFGAGSTLTLTAEDCEAVLQDCPSIAHASPIVRMRGQIVYQDHNWVPSTSMGVSPDYLEVRQWSDLTEGECFSEADVRNAARVCLVGQTIAREVFDGVSPVGKDLRIQNVAFRVVGVLSAKGANTWGQDQDDTILVPYTTAKMRVGATNSAGTNAANNPTASSSSSSSSTPKPTYPGSSSFYPPVSTDQFVSMATKPRFANIDQIIAAAASPADIKPAMSQITVLLRERHHIREGEPEDFNIRDMTEGANTLASSTTMMTNLLLAVALISLAVGGVGIMNIMLVSVTERTREIGLRLAVGARGSEVLLQFLTEAIALCLTGGALGFAFGRGFSMLVNAVLRWPVEPSLSAAVAAFAVSGTIGMVFGFYPAWKAARLDPIEALRYE